MRWFLDALLDVPEVIFCDIRLKDLRGHQKDVAEWSDKLCRAGILKDAMVSWYDLRSLQDELMLITGERDSCKTLT